MYTKSRRRRDSALFACARILFIAGLTPAAAGAATFTVSSTGDAGAGSLRDAVDQANRSPGADTISFSGGIGSTIILSSGAIDIFDALTIAGPGAPRLSLSGNNTSRIFHVAPATPGDVFAVSISGLGLINASTPDDGGAVFVGDSDLTVSNCVFRNNAARRGGGLYAFPTGPTTLTLRNSRFENNSASTDGGGFGAQDIDTVIVENVTATGNTAAKNGGGAFIRAVSLTVSLSEFSNNTSSTVVPGMGDITGGGGLRADGSKTAATAMISATRFNGNTSQKGQGGALWVSALPPDALPIVATSTLDGLQVSGNTADLAGGGIFGGQVNVTLRNSSVTGNNAQQAGGGIAFQNAGSLDLVNLTLAGNASALASGGGLYSASATALSIASSTIAGNSAASGGGIARDGAGATLRNSIIANNNAPASPDLSGAFAPNYTLVKNSAGATLAAGSGNLATGTDPLLGALGINGGPTLSLLPAVGSPALNAGDPGGAGLPATDQRGLPRITGGRVELGAVERQSPEDMIFRSGFQ